MLDQFCKTHSVWGCQRCAEDERRIVDDLARQLLDVHCVLDTAGVPIRSQVGGAGKSARERVEYLIDQVRVLTERAKQLQAQRDGYKTSLEKLQDAQKARRQSAEMAAALQRLRDEALDGLQTRVEALEQLHGVIGHSHAAVHYAGPLPESEPTPK